MIVRLHNTENDLQRMRSFLRGVGTQGIDILCGSTTNILTESCKILKGGCIYVFVEQNVFLALIGFYCDKETQTANLKVLCCQKGVCGERYAQSLLYQMITDCRHDKMIRIQCNILDQRNSLVLKSVGFIVNREQNRDTCGEFCFSYYPIENQLIDFLSRIDSDFYPPLSLMVNFIEYVRKIQEKANLVMEWDDDELVGLVILYCNDRDSLSAYIPVLGVDSSYRGKGIAKKILQSAIQIVSARGFKTLKLKANNPIAIHLYKGQGFKEISQFDGWTYLELEVTQLK